MKYWRILVAGFVAALCLNVNAVETDSICYYTATPVDGEKTVSLADQLHLSKKGEKSTDWMVDVASRLQIHGYAHAGYQYQSALGNSSNTFFLKRTIFWVNAQITPRWSFLFMHNFNSVVQEYYTDFRATRNNLVTFRLGQFKTAVTYENPLSPSAQESVEVYSEGVAYLAGNGNDPLSGIKYGRDLGLAVFGETNNKLFRYEVQVTNGAGVNRKDFDNAKNVIGRLELRPVQGLNICVTGQIGRGYAMVDKPIFNPTIEQGQGYKSNRFSVGADYKSKWVNVHGEYLQGIDGNVTSRGGYFSGSVAILPQTLEAVAGYDYFNFATGTGMDMHKVIAGLQYWFFKKCRIQLQYIYKNAYTDYTTFFNRGGNHQLVCQLQVRFN